MMKSLVAAAFFACSLSLLTPTLAQAQPGWDRGHHHGWHNGRPYGWRHGHHHGWGRGHHYGWGHGPHYGWRHHHRSW
ncbi:hypothetical protein M2323_002465 [Rhodoblastus acidophilus]|uniref:hypothetical protein n=1 Tax=Rhodoblastus acidophilus TaxID=1074 RepID=UPI0022247784|nr:hypothetical protein [Rhodoblastus acidophilus]MCW2284578.1 hypothetical protein [Rhodoblastus acidophilus]MCW2333531.1 hypothetical protein [Rhodoblastus acidophilus]